MRHTSTTDRRSGLFLLMFAGVYLFILPYVTKRRTAEE